MATKHFFGGRVIHGTEFTGYKYKFFEPGTSTPKTTYKDSSLTVGNENAHPVVLDANGAAQIWFDGNADCTLYTAADVVVYTDNDVNVTTSSSTSGSGNLVNNGSFETDSDADGIPDSWTRTLYTAGTFELITTDQFNGQKSVKFTSVGTGGGYITSTDTYAISPSVAYTVGWAMKGTADVRNVVEILWYQDDGTASAISSSTTVYDDSTTNPTSWAEKWYEATSPSDAAFAKIKLTGCHSSDATSGSTTYDSVVFTDLVHKRSPNTISGVTSMSGKAFNLAKGTSIAAAGTMNVWGTDGNLLHITGSGTIASFGTAPQAGARRKAIVDGTFVVAHDGTRIVTEGTTNISASPDDRFEIIADTTTKHYIEYTKSGGDTAIGTVILTTSGTAHDFTIPFGVNLIVISFSGVSLSGTDNFLVQLGDAGGIEATTYEAYSLLITTTSTSMKTSSVGFIMASNGAGNVASGHMILTRHSGNSWVSSHTVGLSSADGASGGGNKTLSEVLTTVRLTRTGTDTFDLGSVNVIYGRN